MRSVPQALADELSRDSIAQIPLVRVNFGRGTGFEGSDEVYYISNEYLSLNESPDTREYLALIPPMKEKGIGDWVKSAKLKEDKCTLKLLDKRIRQKSFGANRVTNFASNLGWWSEIADRRGGLEGARVEIAIWYPRVTGPDALDGGFFVDGKAPLFSGDITEASSAGQIWNIKLSYEFYALNRPGLYKMQANCQNLFAGGEGLELPVLQDLPIGCPVSIRRGIGLVDSVVAGFALGGDSTSILIDANLNHRLIKTNPRNFVINLRTKGVGIVQAVQNIQDGTVRVVVDRWGVELLDGTFATGPPPGEPGLPDPNTTPSLDDKFVIGPLGTCGQTIPDCMANGAFGPNPFQSRDDLPYVPLSFFFGLGEIRAAEGEVFTGRRKELRDLPSRLPEGSEGIKRKPLPMYFGKIGIRKHESLGLIRDAGDEEAEFRHTMVIAGHGAAMEVSADSSFRWQGLNIDNGARLGPLDDSFTTYGVEWPFQPVFTNNKIWEDAKILTRIQRFLLIGQRDSFGWNSQRVFDGYFGADDEGAIRGNPHFFNSRAGVVIPRSQMLQLRLRADLQTETIPGLNDFAIIRGLTMTPPGHPSISEDPAAMQASIGATMNPNHAVAIYHYSIVQGIPRIDIPSVLSASALAETTTRVGRSNRAPMADGIIFTSADSGETPPLFDWVVVPPAGNPWKEAIGSEATIRLADGSTVVKRIRNVTPTIIGDPGQDRDGPPGGGGRGDDEPSDEQDKNQRIQFEEVFTAPDLPKSGDLISTDFTGGLRKNHKCNGALEKAGKVGQNLTEIGRNANFDIIQGDGLKISPRIAADLDAVMLQPTLTNRGPARTNDASILRVESVKWKRIPRDKVFGKFEVSYPAAERNWEREPFHVDNQEWRRKDQLRFRDKGSEDRSEETREFPFITNFDEAAALGRRMLFEEGGALLGSDQMGTLVIVIKNQWGFLTEINDVWHVDFLHPVPQTVNFVRVRKVKNSLSGGVTTLDCIPYYDYVYRAPLYEHHAIQLRKYQRPGGEQLDNVRIDQYKDISAIDSEGKLIPRHRLTFSIV